MKMMSLSRLLLWFAMLSLEWKKLSSQEDNTITGPGFRIQPPFYIRYPKRRDHVRRQKPYPASFPFPCTNATWTGRSLTAPNSAHRLRPADVDVVGAMGDSLVAGNGALEEWALGALIEYRGVSWCAGGEGTWREFLTLPNILKEFNPDLAGYSIGTGEYLASNSGMNVGFPVSSDEDALQQAKVLVARMRADPRVDVPRHWKLITVFFGANDLCSAYCFSGHEGGGWTPRQHAHKLARALDYLQAHLPRTFVNLIPVLDVSVSVRVRRSPMCRLMHTLFCSCFHQGGNELEMLIAAARLYQQAEEDLVLSGRYDQREDFTVVIQPFMKLFNAPGPPLPHPLPDVIDVSYVTHDCFHFSQKGHALAANMLWNNMLQPVGSKSTKKMDYVLQKFLCPSQRAPFFFTSKNSKTFYQTGHQ